MESGDEPRPKAAKDGHVVHVGAGNRFQRGSGPDPAAFEVEATEPDGVRASQQGETGAAGRGESALETPLPWPDHAAGVSTTRRSRRATDASSGAVGDVVGRELFKFGVAGSFPAGGRFQVTDYRKLLGPGPRISDEDLERIVEAMRPLAEVAIDIALARLAEARRAQPPDPGKLISVADAARMAGVTAEQFYRRTAFRPAIVKLGHRTMRVDEKRLLRILQSR